MLIRRYAKISENSEPTPDNQVVTRVLVTDARVFDYAM